MRPLLALALFSGGCCGAPLGGNLEARPPEEVACASDGYRPNDCRVYELGADQFQLMVEEDEHLRRDAVEFAHRQLPKLCREGFDIVSSGVSFRDDYGFFAGEHQDVVVSMVIRCVHAPASAAGPPLAAGARRAPVVPAVGGPSRDRTSPGPSAPDRAVRTPVVPREDVSAPGPASP